MQFRNILEIGTVYPNNKSDRDKNNRNNGQYTHYLIQFGTHGWMIDVQLVIEDFTITVGEFGGFIDIIL